MRAYSEHGVCVWGVLGVCGGRGGGVGLGGGGSSPFLIYRLHNLDFQMRKLNMTPRTYRASKNSIEHIA